MKDIVKKLNEIKEHDDSLITRMGNQGWVF